MARAPKHLPGLILAIKGHEQGSRGPVLEGEDVTWWAALSDRTARSLRHSFSAHDVPLVLYERTGAFADIGRLGKKFVLALQFTETAGDVAEDWPLDVAFEDVGISLVAPLSRLLAGYNPLTNHSQNAVLIRKVQEKIMPVTIQKPAAKTAPAAAKAAPAAAKAPPVAAPKPTPAPATKAAPATAPKAGPPANKPATPPAAAPKPTTAAPGGPPKAGPPTTPKAGPPAAAPAGNAALEARLTALEAAFKQLNENDLATILSDHTQRIGSLENLIRWGEGAGYGPNGEILLDFSEWRSPEALRSWAFAFHSEELALSDAQTIIETLTAQMGAEGGIAVVNDGPVPDSVLAAIDADLAAEPGGDDGTPGTLQPEDVDTMDANKLKATATELGIDFSDMAKRVQPNVLRDRIKAFLAAAQGGETEAEGEGSFAEGAEVNVVASDGATYAATVVSGPDAEGNYTVKWDGTEDTAETAAETVSARLPATPARHDGPHGNG